MFTVISKRGISGSVRGSIGSYNCSLHAWQIFELIDGKGVKRVR